MTLSGSSERFYLTEACLISGYIPLTVFWNYSAKPQDHKTLTRVKLELAYQHSMCALFTCHIYCMTCGLLWYAIKQFILNKNKVFYQAFSKGSEYRDQKGMTPYTLCHELCLHTTPFKGFRLWKQRERYSF